MNDPTVAALDIETYGACETNAAGDTLPRQTVFHPRRSLLTDLVPLPDLILSCSLTFPIEDPRCHSELTLSNNGAPSPNSTSSTPTEPTTTTTPTVVQRSEDSWNGSLLSLLSPGPTMVFLLHLPEHRKMLASHLRRLDTLLGHNLPFDLTYLRAWSEFHPLITERLTLIDTGILNFIQSELRPEKSLKDLGPVLSTHLYDEGISLKEGQRYPSPLDEAFINYNGADTHNTLLLAASLASLTERDFPSSPKLSPLAIAHWSDALWAAVRMTEAGIPLHRPSVQALETRCLREADDALRYCAEDNLLLEGKGSPDSKNAFMAACFKACDTPETTAKLGCAIYDHSAVSITKVKREVSTDKVNRVLAQQLLPADSPLRAPLAAWISHTEAHGIVSKYTAPLLSRRRSETSKTPFDSLLLPTPGIQRFWLHGLNPRVQITYPKWYITPSPYKDASGGSGGQKQARPSAQSPQAQQWPDPMRDCRASRFDDGVICGGDLSQIEMRVPALLSGDLSLVTAYLEDRDLHADRAVFIFGPDIVNDPGWRSGNTLDDPRQWCKKFNFEDLYRAGPKKMQQILLKESHRLFPLDFFEEVVSSRTILRPGLMSWQDQLIYTAKRDGYLILPFTGHSRYFEPGLPSRRFNSEDAKFKENEIVNFPVQATAAIVLSFILSYILKRLPPLSSTDPPCFFIMNWYDALWFDCRRSFLPTLRALYSEAVTHVETRGYWSWLQDLHGRRIPLKYEWKELSPCPASATNP